MCIDDRNYLELCNDILSELYFEEFDSLEEMKQTEEGRRCMKLLNRALTFICNAEEGAWTFRDSKDIIVPTEGMKYYEKPNGFIQYIKYPKNNLVLSYIDEHKYAVDYTTGMPVSYWMYRDQIRLYPIPNTTYEDNPLEIHYLTYDYAKDCCGQGKPIMECETDTPIIPNNHRDILVWKVCMDWRANLADAKTQYYRDQYKYAYQVMLSDCRETYDLPNGLTFGEGYTSYADQLLNILNNPYTIPRPTQGND